MCFDLDDCDDNIAGRTAGCILSSEISTRRLDSFNS